MKMNGESGNKESFPLGCEDEGINVQLDSRNVPVCSSLTVGPK